MVMRESQQIAAEHRDLAAHAHCSGAERHGKEDHPTGHESSRRALEHSNKAYLHSQEEHEKTRTEHSAGAIAANEEMRTYAVVSTREHGAVSGSAGQSGDTQGLPDAAEAGAESVQELAEEGQSYEAEATSGVENAPDPDVAEVHTRQVAEDDVPSEYLKRD